MDKKHQSLQWFDSQKDSERFFKENRLMKVSKELSKLLLSDGTLKICDLGAGDGGYTRLLAQTYPQHQFYGSDIDPRAVERNQGIENLTWDIVDCNNSFPYNDNFFDVVIAGEIIEHLYDTDTFLSECYRILKPGGTIIITTPNLSSLVDRIFLLIGWQPIAMDTSAYDRIFGRELFYSIRGISHSQSNNHLRCFTRGALRSVVSYHKFKVKKQLGCYIQGGLFGKIVTFFVPFLAQGQIIIAGK